MERIGGCMAGKQVGTMARVCGGVFAAGGDGDRVTHGRCPAAAGFGRRAGRTFWTSWATGGRTGLLVVAAVLPVIGCQKNRPEPAADGQADTTPDRPAATRETSASAHQILQRMVAAYQQAKSYADAGQLHYEAIAGGVTQQSEPVPLSVTLARPNRVRAQMFDAVAVADGKQIHAAIKQLAGQVLEVPAPPRLTLANFPPDEVLRLAMTGGQALFASPQMGLLLAENPLRAIVNGAEAVTLLEDGAVDGQACARVLVRRADGKYVYWVDKKDSTLRRVDLPTKELLKQIAQGQGLTDLKVWIEMRGAQLGGAVDTKAFQFEVPPNAKRLTRFVTPLPGPKPQHIGETIGDFQFTDLAGHAVTRASLHGKIALIDFWFTTCPPCRQSMPILEKVYQQYKDHPGVAFLAVSVDKPEVSNDQLRQTLESWGASMPIVRDRKNQAASTFKIVGAPSTFLLGPDGKIQAYKVGLHPNYDDLRAAIDLLLSGKSPADQMLAQYQARVKDFEAQLAAAAVGAKSTIVEVPRTKIAPASKPKTVKLEKQWHCAAVKQPGNLLVIRQPDRPARIFVLDGWRTVVELTPAGAVVGRHQLPLPERQAVSFLRTARDQKGNRYFAASGVAQQKVYLFDANWKLQWSFPDGEHAGIADVRLADLEGKGKLEMVVGYWGVVGVQGVSMAGKRLWSNRSLQNALQLAVTDPDAQGRRSVLCVNSRGTLVPIDYQGKQRSDILVPNRAMIHLTAADVDGDGKRDLCGLAATGVDRRTAVGIDQTGHERWHYRLPDGVQKHQIEAVVPALLPNGNGGWLLPGPDGSIHLLTGQGKPIDHFNSGAALTGLALLPTDHGAELLVANDRDGLIAYQMTLPDSH